MPFVKGKPPPKNSGRPRGSVNKITGLLKDMILQSLADAGGVAYLVQQSQANPSAYLSLIGRVLPLQVKQDGDEPAVPAPVIHEHHTS